VILYKIFRLTWHLLQGVILVLTLFPWLSDKAQLRMEWRWHSNLLRILNIKLRVHGVAPTLSVHNMFLVSNHISWLDVYLLNSVRPVSFVSKAEVRSWPVIGWLAKKTGTIFIDRTKRHDTARVNREISAILNCGGCVAIFPEGTTTDGSSLRTFHSSLLQPAVHSNCAVWPVAIRYIHLDGSLNITPAYIDEMNFVDSLLLILRQPAIYAEITFKQPIQVLGKTRRELAQEAELVIAKTLNLPSKHRTGDNRGKGVA